MKKKKVIDKYTLIFDKCGVYLSITKRKKEEEENSVLLPGPLRLRIVRMIHWMIVPNLFLLLLLMMMMMI